MEQDDSLPLLDPDDPVRLAAQLIEATTARAREHRNLRAQEQECGTMPSQFMTRFHHTAEEPNRLVLRYRLIVEGIKDSGKNGDTRLIAIKCGHQAVGNEPLQLM